MKFRNISPVIISLIFLVIGGIVLHANFTFPAFPREQYKTITTFYGRDITLLGIAAITWAGLLYREGKIEPKFSFIIETCFYTVGIGTFVSIFAADPRRILLTLFVPFFILLAVVFKTLLHPFLKSISLQKDWYFRFILLLLILLGVICSPIPRIMYSII